MHNCFAVFLYMQCREFVNDALFKWHYEWTWTNLDRCVSDATIPPPTTDESDQRCELMKKNNFFVSLKTSKRGYLFITIRYINLINVFTCIIGCVHTSLDRSLPSKGSLLHNRLCHFKKTTAFFSLCWLHHSLHVRTRINVVKFDARVFWLGIHDIFFQHTAISLFQNTEPVLLCYSLLAK